MLSNLAPTLGVAPEDDAMIMDMAPYNSQEGTAYGRALRERPTVQQFNQQVGTCRAV
jgi:hypothetical protein